MIPPMSIYPDYSFLSQSKTLPTHSKPLETFSQNPDILPRPLVSFNESVSFTPFGQLPPIPDSHFSIKELQISSPRLLRFSLNSIPISQSLLLSSGLPLACILHPLAQLNKSDTQIPELDYFPYRCTTCYAYTNPNFTFINNSNKLMCNICETIQLVPEQYANKKDAIETNSPSYDFTAPADISSKFPSKPIVLVCIEKTFESVKLGIFSQVLNSLYNLIDYISQECFLGILTFGKGASLYRMKAGSLTEIKNCDLDDPFSADCWENVCLNIGGFSEQIKEMIQKILELPDMDEGCISVGYLLKIVSTILNGCGGRVLVFSSSPGIHGKFKIPLIGTRKPIHDIPDKVYQPDEQYKNIANECVDADITVDLFVCTNAEVGLGSLCELCTVTGGDLYYFPGFSSEKDTERMHYYLSRVLTREQVSQFSLKVRCTRGVSVESYIGKFRKKGAEIYSPLLDSDKTICLQFRYDSTLIEEKDYFIQIALLFTTRTGKRIIRVLNGKFYSTHNFYSIFQSADIDAIVNSNLKQAASQVKRTSINQIRNDMNSSLVKLLVRMRQIGTDNNFSKILLPDSLKYLPLFMNSALKLPAFTTGNLSLETRFFSIHALQSMSVLQTRLLLYPKIHEIDTSCFALAKNLIPCSLSSIKKESFYVLNNGDVVLLILGENIPEEVYFKIWNTSKEELFHSQEHWKLDGPEGVKIKDLISQICVLNPCWQYSIYVYIQGLSDDYMVKRLMVEDQTGPETSYCDFITRLQKTLINQMTDSY